MVEVPPPHEAHQDRLARGQGWRLCVPPAVFLAHFGLVYGWAGIVCAFGWPGRLGPFGWLEAGVLLLTLAAALVLWFARAPVAPPAPEQMLRAYDPAERAFFLASVTRMVGWLALVGILMVAAMVPVAGACGNAP